jgi:peptidoglycan/LPS O-acetylase OafA/YrhL
LTYNYRENLSSATKRYQFWWARFARIYPLHILTFLLAVVPFVYAHSDWSPTLLSEIGIAHILLLQAWLPVAGDKYVTAFNGPSWTLSVEAFFYLSFPLWIVVADRLAKRFWRLPAMIIVVWLVVVGAQLLWGTPSFGNWATSINPLALSVEFFAGIGLGYIYHRYRIEVKSQFQFARWWWVPVVVLLATIVWAPTYVSLPVRDMAVYLPCMVAIIWMMALQDDTTFALARKRWHRLGEASFAFYMLHIVVFLWTVDPINKLWHPSTWIIICVLMADFVLTLMLSLGVFQWFETPMRKWLRQRITFG